MKIQENQDKTNSFFNILKNKLFKRNRLLVSIIFVILLLVFIICCIGLGAYLNRKRKSFNLFTLELTSKPASRQLIAHQQHYDSTGLSFININFYYDKLINDTLCLLVDNKSNLNLNLRSISYNNKLIFLDNDLMIKLDDNSIDVIQNIKIVIPNSVNLSAFSSDSLRVNYFITGQNDVMYSSIVFPKIMTEEDYDKLNFTQQSPNFNKFEFISIDEANKTVLFNRDCNIKESILIPKGYTVIAKSGIRINLLNHSRIISYSPLSIKGTKDSVITFLSTDSTGQGFIVFNCEKESELKHLKFLNLSNIYDFGWDLRGAITFYRSPVKISYCEFDSNLRGDDYLNIISSKFYISHTIFNNTIADAFDTDFAEGTIEKTKFINSGNDAIDISGTYLEVKDVDILNTDDKAISVGEGSYFVGDNIKINFGELAVVAKDKSTVEITNLTVQGSRLVYCAFQKKPEFGPGIIKIKNAKLQDVERKHLIEVGSTLIIDNKEVTDKSTEVQEVLYGIEYGKASVR